ncbi:MAG: hypothetical protein VCE91_11460 [Nitrospinota bacterium]
MIVDQIGDHGLSAKVGHFRAGAREAAYLCVGAHGCNPVPPDGDSLCGRKFPVHREDLPVDENPVRGGLGK